MIQNNVNILWKTTLAKELINLQLNWALQPWENHSLCELSLPSSSVKNPDFDQGGNEPGLI